MSTIFPNLILLLFLVLYASLSESQDAQLLLRFKSSLPNPSLLRDWQPSLPHCSFSGVHCNNVSSVNAVDLSFFPLRADFRSVVSNLFALNSLHSLSLQSTLLNGRISGVVSTCGAFLTDVDLSNNSISGTVFDLAVFTSSCPSLKTLNLSLNSFLNSDENSDVAAESSLQEFDISFNRISGVGGYLFKWLRDLKYISLKGNKLNGALPSFSHCVHLEHLDLSSNNFTSGLPSLASCSSLRHVDLSSNSFTGDLFAGELSKLKQLEFLNLSSNRLSGEISGIPTVKLLNLSGNHFYGALNDDLIVQLCGSLIDLDFSYNNLTGTIPPGFSQCVHLESLNLSNNSLTGNLPVDILVKMTNLRNLVLAYNYFLGPLTPDLVISLAFLESLDLSSNNISGHIPPDLCSVDSIALKEFYLQNNFFSGSIPATLSNCTQLVSLDLSFNFLKGGIPQSFNTFAHLRDLILWQNDLTGEIPNMGNMRMLESLILDFNDLTGEIPSSLSNCENLNWISLSNNRLSGPIPSWIERLSSLAILKLSNNSFYGQIPSELGNCQSLIWVDLNSNSLTGQIPASLFKQSGKIADTLSTRKRYAYIKNDKSSMECHGAGNLLEFVGIRAAQLGRISPKSPCNFPRVYGGNVRPTFIHNGSIIFFDVSYNSLSGVIPKEMGSMFYLQVLHLSHNNLSGQIPPELGALTTLSILDLSHNKLDGIIPPSFSGLSSLVELDLSNNRLYGRIPNSAQMTTFQNYTFLNNSNLCGYPLKPCNGALGVNSSAPRGSKSSHGQASFAGTIAMGLLFSLFCVFGLVMIAVETKKRRAKNGTSSNSTLDVYVGADSANHSGWKLTGTREALSINLATFDKPLRKLTFADLLEATNGFHSDTLIGSGGFGDVYRARLKDRTTVAIKKLIHVNGQGDREFNSEMETIGKIKHRNLVPLLGYCKVREERLLVYEYMKHGSLEDVLHDRRKAGIKLKWAARRRIALGAARGLAFLHHNCNPCIIHRDMKSSNVLLDDDLEARVSDFGMARLMSTMDTHLSVSTLAGTPGYVPPEYYQSFRCTTKGDVYSYGVVLLELLTGRQPTDLPEFGENNNLVGWVKQHATEKMIGDVFDPELIKEVSVNKVEEIELLQHLNVATKCLEDRPFYRPTMIQVMAMFKDIQVGGGETMEFESGSTGVVEMSIKECDDELRSVNSLSGIDSSCSGNSTHRNNSRRL